LTQSRETKIADETKCVCRLTARRVFADGKEAGAATSSGFFWRHRGCVYVVTNWHCLSGSNAKTLKPLGTFFPDRLIVEGKLIKPDASDPKRSYLAGFRYEVMLEDSEGRRLWIEHPAGHVVDVAAFQLPIEEDGGYSFCCLNEIEYEKRWRPDVGSDAFIIGYTEGISSAHTTPIWKRASIASEPDLQYEDSPLFLVDTLGTKGYRDLQRA